MLLSLETGTSCGSDEQYIQFSRNTVKGVKRKETGVTMSWIYELTELETTEIIDATIEIENEQDNGQYFTRPQRAVGVVIHSTKYPAVMASWYADNHEGFWNVYGEQGVGTQQTYYLSGATTVFVGLF